MICWVTLVIKLSCSSACLAILTACFDNISFVFSFVCATFYTHKQTNQDLYVNIITKTTTTTYLKSKYRPIKNHIIIYYYNTLERSLNRCLTFWKRWLPFDWYSSVSSLLDMILLYINFSHWLIALFMFWVLIEKGLERWLD